MPTPATLLLALTVTPPATTSGTAPLGATGLPIEAHADWLVCKDICVPEHGTFRLTLPFGPPAPSAQAPLFAAAADAVPRPSPWAAVVAPDGRLWLHGPGLDPAAVRRARFIPDRAEAIRDDAPQPLGRTPHGIVLRLAPGSAFAPRCRCPE